MQVSHIRLESDGGSSPQEDFPAAPLSAPPTLRPIQQLPHPQSSPAAADLSWDSESQVSQTSSTSGYRFERLNRTKYTQHLSRSFFLLLETDLAYIISQIRVTRATTSPTAKMKNSPIT